MSSETPKLTLTLILGSDYTIKYSGRDYAFKNGETVTAPPGVAIQAEKLNHHGKPLFRIENMPTVVRPEPVISKKKAKLGNESEGQVSLMEEN